MHLELLETGWLCT